MHPAHGSPWFFDAGAESLDFAYTGDMGRGVPDWERMHAPRDLGDWLAEHVGPIHPDDASERDLADAPRDEPQLLRADRQGRGDDEEENRSDRERGEARELQRAEAGREGPEVAGRLDREEPCERAEPQEGRGRRDPVGPARRPHPQRAHHRRHVLAIVVGDGVAVR